MFKFYHNYVCKYITPWHETAKWAQTWKLMTIRYITLIMHHLKDKHCVIAIKYFYKWVTH